jgi:hypothetical protein
VFNHNEQEFEMGDPQLPSLTDALTGFFATAQALALAGEAPTGPASDRLEEWRERVVLAAQAPLAEAFRRCAWADDQAHAALQLYDSRVATVLAQEAELLEGEEEEDR